jgi:hypothetical protein
MSDRRSSDPRSREEVQRLLSRAPIIRSACDLDLLVFFHRHPRVLLTSEQLAAFLGYEMNGIAKAIEAFVEGGVLERTQNPAHAARLYVLAIRGPQGGGLGAILELASTRPGRQQILALLEPSEAAPSAVQEKSSRESIKTEVLYARH